MKVSMLQPARGFADTTLTLTVTQTFVSGAAGGATVRSSYRGGDRHRPLIEAVAAGSRNSKKTADHGTKAAKAFVAPTPPEPRTMVAASNATFYRSPFSFLRPKVI